jgi:hypothetical protein
LLHNRDWESIVHKDLQDTSIFESNEHALLLRGTADYFDVLDLRVHDPLAFENAREGEQLDLLFEDKDQVLGHTEEQVAVYLLVYLFVGFVLHIVRILVRDRVDDDLLRELNGQTILINGDLLDVISAPDLDSGLSNQVLNNDISHELSVSISILIQPMNRIKFNRIHANGSRIRPCKDIL